MLPKIFKLSKLRFNLPIFVVLVGVILGLMHLFSYLLPFTDEAFVVANVRPVAADVNGFITKIYVKNGQRVKASEPLFEVYQEPYKLAYQQATADYEEALAQIRVIEAQTEKTKALLSETQDKLGKAQYEYGLKSDVRVSKSVAKLDIVKLSYDVKSLSNSVKSLQKQLAVEEAEIKRQQQKVLSLDAIAKNALVNLNLTTVRAATNGVVDNMYLSVGTPIIRNQPLFSFVDTATWWIQANFDETDLRRVRPGNKVIVILRMYYFDKIFHGIIVNDLWPSDRQVTSSRTQQQVVVSTNEWLELPQRFPLQIKILDPDPKYPLNPGASAYVYIQTW